VNFPIPKSTKEIKSFLGLCGFYRKFIPNFAKIAKPMSLRLKKGSIINIKDTDYYLAFEKLKMLITSGPILIHPDFKKSFFALGAVLSREKEKGTPCYCLGH